MSDILKKLYPGHHEYVLVHGRLEEIYHLAISGDITEEERLAMITDMLNPRVDMIAKEEDERISMLKQVADLASPIALA